MTGNIFPEKDGERIRDTLPHEGVVYTLAYVYIYIVCGIIWSLLLGILAPDKRFTATILSSRSSQPFSLSRYSFGLLALCRDLCTRHTMHNYIILLFISADALVVAYIVLTGASMLNPFRVVLICRRLVTKQFQIPQSRSNVT